MSNAYSIIQIGDVIQTKNDKSKQLQSSEYLKSGVLPIVDQGAKSVCGYTNDLTKSYDKGLPVVVFGDHTLHTKYVDFNFAIGADGTQVLTPKSKGCDVKYLYYLITRAAELIGSEGYKRHFKILKEFDIEYVDSLPEQQKIATILSSVDDVIEKTRTQIDKLKDLKTGMMQELLTKGIGHTEFKDSPVGRIPECWDVCSASEIASEIMVGVVVKPTQYYVESGVPALRSANVRENGLTMDNLKYLSEASNEILKKSRLVKGDLLTVRTGYPGTTAVVTDEFAGCNCIDVVITRPSSRINSDFFCLWVNSDHGKSQVLKAQGGLAQQHFNVGDMRNLAVVVPSLPEQIAIFEAVDSVTKKIHLTEKRFIRLFKVKKALMQDLLTGKVRVNLNESAAIENG